ncbi:MAG: NUMOD3 domain-containing DNA-binding protein [Sulfuricaulis sp.]|nr:NUMOD3 domain-containing DNA-binding protein [Sulfuricaulis sp.]
MEKQFYIYLHCKPDGSPFYVGKGCDKRSHATVCGRNAHHNRVVKKYGRANIGIFVFHCESEQHALDDEVSTIKQLRSEGYVLANCSDGGEGTVGYNHTEAARMKMSAAKKGKESPLRGKKSSTETRAKQSAARKGNVKLAEHCRKLSAANAVRQISDETRAKLRVAHTGRTASAETRAKISASKIGRQRPDLALRNIGNTYGRRRSIVMVSA